MSEQFKNMTEEEIFSYLLKKYKNNEDVLETIDRAKADVEYLRTKKEGLTPKQYLTFLAANLEMWY